MDDNAVQYQTVGRVAVITLNRPEKLNAINDAVLRGLDAALERALQEDVRGVVLRGAGRAFSVGQDLGTEGTSEVLPPNPMSVSLAPDDRRYADEHYVSEAHRRERLERIFNFPKFTVARVQGYCLGMGCDIAMMCRYIICSEDAVFGDPSVRMGNVSPNPLWVYRVGIRKAKELLLTGRYVDGKEAESIGLASRAVRREDLDATVEKTVDALLQEGDPGGYDRVMAGRHRRRDGNDAAGLGTAWGFAANYAVISQMQRFGFPGQSQFWKVRAETGWKEAVRRRDAEFTRDFPIPKPWR